MSKKKKSKMGPPAGSAVFDYQRQICREFDLGPLDDGYFDYQRATELAVQWIRENGVGEIDSAKCVKSVKASMRPVGFLGGITLWWVLGPIIQKVVSMLIEWYFEKDEFL